MSITTTTTTNGFEQTRFDYLWYSAFLFGHEATGWGEYEFSATSAASAPLRPRPEIPAPGPGTTFNSAPAWSQTDTVVKRLTNLGEITVTNNVTTHSAAFIAN